MSRFSFAQAEHQNKKKVTAEERFLAQMNALVPWHGLIDATVRRPTFRTRQASEGGPAIGLRAHARIYYPADSGNAPCR